VNRKGLTVGLILLLIVTSVIQISAQDVEKSSQSTSRGSWLYVGGSGPGNYTRIQDAINDSKDGDTVFVFDDSSPYEEHLSIDQSITLQGENKTTTIIEGWSSICSDYVIVKDFMFYIYGPALRIENFSNAIIESCVFNWSALIGLIIENSTNDIIRNCTFNNNTNDLAVFVKISSSKNIEISYCDFFDNPEAWAFGSLIYIETSSGITIHHCSCAYNYGFVVGVYFSRGITIHHCNFTYNYGGGVCALASVVHLTSNNFINNTGPGVELRFLWACDLRDNWWGSPQGPSINFTIFSLDTLYERICIRDVDNGDTIHFYGLTRIGRLLRFICLLPKLSWRSEPVSDAGS
jgi:hypothetical protein